MRITVAVNFDYGDDCDYGDGEVVLELDESVGALVGVVVLDEGVVEPGVVAGTVVEVVVVVVDVDVVLVVVVVVVVVASTMRCPNKLI
jgi:hypothetical protein